LTKKLSFQRLLARANAAHMLCQAYIAHLDRAIHSKPWLTEFGYSLAHSRALSQKQAEHGRKLVRKYHRQLPADRLQRALG